MSTTNGLPLQAHTNVRDVLAPLFSNGRSFSSLIDELSRYFKLEPGLNSNSYGAAYRDDSAGVLEASSESQSTDSEAEGNVSDEADSRLVQARISVQTRSNDATVATHGKPSSIVEPLQVRRPTTAAVTQTPVKAQPAAMRRTRSRSRRQQQQQQQQQETEAGSVAAAAKGVDGSSETVGRGKKKSRERRGKVPLVNSGGSAPPTSSNTASGAGGTVPSRIGGGGDQGGAGAGRVRGFASADDLTVLSVSANADGWSETVGAALATRARAGYVFAQEVDPDSPQSTEFVREVFVDERSGVQKALELRVRLVPQAQKVLLCSAWVDSGEYLEATARLVAKCQAEVFGIACVRFEQNSSTEGLVDRFNLFAKSMPKGRVPSLNMGMKSCIPASLTKGLHGYTNNRGRGRGGVMVPVAGGAGDALEDVSANGDDVDGNGAGWEGADRAAGATSPPTTDPRQYSSKKRKRTGSAPGRSGVDAAESPLPITKNAGDNTETSTSVATSSVVPSPAAASVPATEPMDEDSMIPATDDVSAGEGLVEASNGGQPAQKQKFGGGAMSESEIAVRLGDGGRNGRGWGKLVGGAMLSEEEGDYSADSERSTDHESMHLYGGGGRESDEQDASERDAFRRYRRRGSGTGGRGRRRSGGAGGNIRRAVGGGRGAFRTSSPETCPDADGENSSGRNSAPGTESRGGGGAPIAASSMESPKRRRVGTGTIGESGRPRDGALLDEVGEQSGSLAHSEASGSGAGGGSGGEEEEEEEEEEAEVQGADAKDVEMRAREGDTGVRVDCSVGIGTVAPLEWKSKLDRQPIFMSRGLREEDPGLLPSHSEGGIHPARSPRRSGAAGLSGLPEDPEDDRDRSSSFSSADSPLPSGSVVQSGKGAGASGVLSAVVIGEGTNTQEETDSAIRESKAAPVPSVSSPKATSKHPPAPPNSLGGAVPWHHTSVYEANNPTEDRHAELSHNALGVKIYCVCDGHGGSRAAQFVCDHLVANVLARVESIAAASKVSTSAAADDDDAAAAVPTSVSRSPPPSSLLPTPQLVEAESETRRCVSSCTGGTANGGDRVGAHSRGGEWTENEAEIRRSLTEAFESCDEEFIAQLDPTKNRGYINAGCCVVLALLIQSKLYIAHVGDCRVVLGTTDASRLSRSSSESPSAGAGHGAAAPHTGKRGGSGVGDKGLAGRGRGRGARAVISPRRGSVSATELGAVALSRDHNCDDGEEAALVRARSGDENAIRVSRSDEWKGARAIKRVAGSLAVTRAIGDAYLKKAAFSFSPYKEGVPYITAEPAVTSLELTSKDRFLVLATDGVWEQVSNEEAVRCVSGALGTPNGRRQRSSSSRIAGGCGGSGGDSLGATGSYSSDALVDLVLARSAQSHGMSVPALRALPRGASRRMLHDDVCATVVHLTPAPPELSPL